MRWNNDETHLILDHCINIKQEILFIFHGQNGLAKDRNLMKLKERLTWPSLKGRPEELLQGMCNPVMLMV